MFKDNHFLSFYYSITISLNLFSLKPLNVLIFFSLVSFCFARVYKVMKSTSNTIQTNKTVDANNTNIDLFIYACIYSCFN